MSIEKKASVEDLVKGAYLAVVVGADSSFICDRETELSPASDGLNSRSFVMMIMSLERGVSERFDVEISLIREELFEDSNYVFRNVGTLTDYIEKMILGGI